MTAVFLHRQCYTKMSHKEEKQEKQEKPEVYSQIRIVLQRPEQLDDVLIVKPDNHSQWYDITFKQNTLGFTTTNSVQAEGLLNYLDSFLRCLLMDEDRVSHVQVDIPTYPTVLLKAHNIPSYYTLLRQKVLNIISHWPLDE